MNVEYRRHKISILTINGDTIVRISRPQVSQSVSMPVRGSFSGALKQVQMLVDGMLASVQDAQFEALNQK